MTDEIIRRMGPADSLTLVELNDRFVASLRARLANDDRWRAAAHRIAIRHMPVEQLAADEPFDAIVSCLPLNNFPAELVRSILEHLERLAATGATLSFFEYIGVRKAKALVCPRAERQRLTAIGQILDQAFREHRFRYECVLANVPPAWVHHLRLNNAVEERAGAE
ncbi:MAG: hypothetical protein IT424_08065 [Pirellulales bacterium]|nr:hypothetical protein [Pirellulales bacterium]